MTIEEATKQAYDRGLEAGWQGVLMTLRPLFEAMLDADLDRWAHGEPLDLTEEEVAFRTYYMTLLQRYCKTKTPYQPEGVSYERVQNNGE
jgi:hypothetical protein